MKAALIYWIIGCLFIGVAWANWLHKCPNDNIPVEEALAAIAIWPAVGIGALVAPRRPSECQSE